MVDENSDFPIQWEKPEHATCSWSRDRMHFPRPLTPMAAAIEGPAFETGFTKAARFYEKPYAGIQVRFFNHYWYQAIVPRSDVAMPTEEKPAQLRERVRTALRIFEQDLLPEILDINQDLLQFDYDGSTDEALLAFFKQSLAMRARIWEIHFLALDPASTAVKDFLQICDELLGMTSPLEPLLMLQGFPNKTISCNSALWNLAQLINDDPIFSSHNWETSPHGWRQKLASTASGILILKHIDEFFQEYGWCSPATELDQKPWVEDPTPVFSLLRQLASNPTPDPSETLRVSAFIREEKTQAALTQLEDHPEKSKFYDALIAAQQYVPLMEDHNYYIDEMNTSLMRLPLLAIGRRLTQNGSCANPQDVFFLNPQELEDIISQSTPEIQHTIERRRSDWERWSRSIPPEHIGIEASEIAGRGRDERFFGPATQAHPHSNLLIGRPASYGVKTAKARIVCSPDELYTFAHGEILVCMTTTPAWTPVFAKASAIVTDTGGELSHMAIIAREYGIPCVVGTGNATSVVRTGQFITVDGGAGTVHLLEE